MPEITSQTFPDQTFPWKSTLMISKPRKRFREVKRKHSRRYLLMRQHRKMMMMMMVIQQIKVQSQAQHTVDQHGLWQHRHARGQFGTVNHFTSRLAKSLSQVNAVDAIFLVGVYWGVSANRLQNRCCTPSSSSPPLPRNQSQLTKTSPSSALKNRFSPMHALLVSLH